MCKVSDQAHLIPIGRNEHATRGINIFKCDKTWPNNLQSGHILYKHISVIPLSSAFPSYIKEPNVTPSIVIVSIHAA